jgi:hypothetical protein
MDISWISAGAAVVSSLMAVTSFVFARLSGKKASKAQEEATKASQALNDLEQERNQYLESLNSRDEIREGAQPWEITNEVNSGFRARNKLNVPLYDVDITDEGGVQIARTETPREIVKDGESFTFVAFAFMQSPNRRVSITYSFEPGGEQKTFSEPLPSENKKK